MPMKIEDKSAIMKRAHKLKSERGLENRIIEAEFTSPSEGRVECRERLGGLLRYYYYYRDAA